MDRRLLGAAMLSSHFGTPWNIVLAGILGLVLAGSGYAQDSGGITGLAREIQLVRDSISPGEEYIDLGVKIVSERRCGQGDLDIIDTEYQENPFMDKRLLLTLEPLFPDPTMMDPLFQVIKHPKDLENYVTTFRIKRFKGEKHLGLFLCRDTNGEKSCQGKRAVNVAKMAKLYAKLQKTPMTLERGVAWDKIYYFQYVVLGDNSIEYLAGTDVSDQRFAKFNKYMTSRMGTDEAYRFTIGQIGGWTQATNSMPLKIEGNTLVVNLPQSDDTRCKKN